jgi:DNA polymerase-3 subunit delta
MASHLGNDLSKITNEIKKLQIATEGRKKITSKDIEEFVGISKEYNVFEFMDGVLACDFEKVFKIAKYFGKTPKENPLPQILSVLFNNFSSIMVYHSLEDKSKSSVQGALKMNPYVLEKLVKNAQNYSYDSAVNAIHQIRLYDMKFKGVDALNMSEGDLLNELLFKIMPAR